MQVLLTLLIPLIVNAPWPEEPTTTEPYRTGSESPQRAGRSTGYDRAARTDGAPRSTPSTSVQRSRPMRDDPRPPLYETPSRRSTRAGPTDPPPAVPNSSYRSNSPDPYSRSRGSSYSNPPDPYSRSRGSPYSNSPDPYSNPRGSSYPAAPDSYSNSRTRPYSNSPPASPSRRQLDPRGEERRGEELEAPPRPAYYSAPARRPVPPPPPVYEERPWYALTEGRRLALGLDLGVFGAAGALAYFRPWDWMRVNAGLSWNYIGFGLRGGVSFTPWRWQITPSLNLEYGQFFTGDLNKFVSARAGSAESELLKQGKYSWASAQLGAEFGSQRRFLFYVRGGFAYVRARVPGDVLAAFITEKSMEQSSSQNASFGAGDARFTGLVPCASIGFLVYIY